MPILNRARAHREAESAPASNTFDVPPELAPYWAEAATRVEPSTAADIEREAIREADRIIAEKIKKLPNPQRGITPSAETRAADLGFTLAHGPRRQEFAARVHHRRHVAEARRLAAAVAQRERAIEADRVARTCTVCGSFDHTTTVRTDSGQSCERCAAAIAEVRLERSRERLAQTMREVVNGKSRREHAATFLDKHQ